ncbi:MAG: sortase family protein [uncultured bacterium (gcode 4)]|uniref:Sortase family protein n=1 Tax=uncultured bacterium (gcode 4) TaxID=1234023 RepID=K2BUE9_9BACT|nr:MAG: sortase family protein [uncultured bacterium (gcode 4)]
MSEIETDNFSELLEAETSINEVDIFDIISHLDEDLSLSSSVEESVVIEENQVQEVQTNWETIFSGLEESSLRVDDIYLEKRKGWLGLVLSKLKIKQKVNFVSHYIFVSIIVFFILLGISNYSAYSKMAYNYINPNYLKNSSREILDAMDDSKIKVFADSLSSEDLAKKEAKLKKKMEEENIDQVKDTYFSPKKLVSFDDKISLDLEVTPYENRIIIPKLGKNIPLVDVNNKSWLNFENLQDLFMKELEKWILRYPGTATPGSLWNAFIFWHSSNYPWSKWDYNDVFALLDNLNFWDEIIVYYNQKKFIYTITEKKVVRPGDVKVLKRDWGKREISLMTCWPVWTTLNRMIVFWEIKEVK